MREVLDEIERWRGEGKQAALATVVKVYGSSPRPLGAKMAISSTGEMSGSVSGGCVEGAVFEELQQAMKSGRPKLLNFGIRNEAAWEVGLACGGKIEVFAEAIDWQTSMSKMDLFDQAKSLVRENYLCALVTVMGGNHAGAKLLVWNGGKEMRGSLGEPELDKIVSASAAGQMEKLAPARLELEFQGEALDLFVDVFAPPLRLVIVGAVHIAIPLVSFAKLLGFYTIVIDARSAFATRERFPHADQLIVKWPSEALGDIALDEGTCVVTLTHDEKLDNPALDVAVRSKARYVGALGSPRTHVKRVEALTEMGLTAEQIARIHAPVGLHIGAKSTEEIGLSIMGEIVSLLHGKTP